MKTQEDLRNIIKHLELPFEVAPLQFQDVMDAYSAGRFALFYDVGGGKTLVSTLIALMYDLPTVVVMPHILLKQWQKWLGRAKVQAQDIYIYYGPKRDADKLRVTKWVLTSHAIFRKDAKIFREKYKGRRTVLLLDEAQIIKDIGSKITQAVNGFIGADNPCVLMTATPISKLEDTYSYMKIKTPGVYRSLSHWEGIHVESRDIFGSIQSYRNLDALKSNFALNAAKRDKVELFGHNLQPILDPIVYDLEPKHLKLYNKLLEEQLLLLPDDTKIDGTTPQRLRHMLQQLVWNPGAFSGNPEDKATGFDLLETLCEQADFMDKTRGKFIIWTYYKSTTEAIYRWMDERYPGAGCVAYGGSNSAKAVDAIMYDENTRWMIANPMSVGAGLELQHVCHFMFFAEMVTTPIPNRQAIGRVDRPGQKVRPYIAIGQAANTVQISLFRDLLRNDEQVVAVERTRTSLRQDLQGK